MKLSVMMRRQVNKRTLVIGTRATFAVATLAAWFGYSSDAATPPPAAALPQVVVSKSLARDSWLGFICQFSAIEQVELRAQVGGTLIGIYFKDGDIVHKGDFLFTVDARPYEIRLAQANAQDRYRPVRAGVAKSWVHPGRNVTGVCLIAPELAVKRLSLLHEALPSVHRIAVLSNHRRVAEAGMSPSKGCR